MSFLVIFPPNHFASIMSLSYHNFYQDKQPNIRDWITLENVLQNFISKICHEKISCLAKSLSSKLVPTRNIFYNHLNYVQQKTKYYNFIYLFLRDKINLNKNDNSSFFIFFCPGMWKTCHKYTIFWYFAIKPNLHPKESEKSIPLN